MKYLPLDVKQLLVWDNITCKFGQEGLTTGDRLSNLCLKQVNFEEKKFDHVNTP